MVQHKTHHVYNTLYSISYRFVSGSSNLTNVHLVLQTNFIIIKSKIKFCNIQPVTTILEHHQRCLTSRLVLFTKTTKNCLGTLKYEKKSIGSLKFENAPEG